MKPLVFLLLVLTCGIGLPPVEAQRIRGVGRSSSATKMGTSSKAKTSTTIKANAGRTTTSTTQAPKFSSSTSTANTIAKTLKNTGRSGREPRLRALANDPKLGNADRGWIKQEMNAKSQGQRSTIRVPPGKELAHKRGYEAAKGYSHAHSDLQARELHRIQHKYDNNGRKQTSQPKQSR